MSSMSNNPKSSWILDHVCEVIPDVFLEFDLAILHEVLDFVPCVEREFVDDVDYCFMQRDLEVFEFAHYTCPSSRNL